MGDRERGFHLPLKNSHEFSAIIFSSGTRAEYSSSSGGKKGMNKTRDPVLVVNKALKFSACVCATCEAIRISLRGCGDYMRIQNAFSNIIPLFFFFFFCCFCTEAEI